MKNILKLVLHKVRHPSHHICFDRGFCGRCGYLEKMGQSFVTRLVERPDPPNTEAKKRKST